MNRLYGISLAFLFAILSTRSYGQEVTAQGIVWPNHPHGRGVKGGGRPPIKEGFIVLAQGDTLKGSIMVPAINPDAYPILVTGTKRVREIVLPDIASMRIYDDKPGRHYADYINLPYTFYLWRLDAGKKDVAIYDDELRGGSRFQMILVTPTARITIYKGTQWPFYNSRINILLTRFIDERYKTSVQAEDFKSTQEIFDYILDKEKSPQEPHTNCPNPNTRTRRQ
jgi:hypothetical protein